jgi:phage tail tape-measure protein
MHSTGIVEHLVAGSLMAVICAGCSNMNNTQKGAAVGAAGGTVVGAIVGKELGNTGAGAAIGALTGLVGGAVVGKSEDDSEAKENAERAAAYEHNMRVREERAIRNSDVVYMTQNGTADDVICNAIRTRGGRFDTSPESVIYLQRSGVSNRVIEVMQNYGG